MGYAPASPQIDVNEDRTKRERNARHATVFCEIDGGSVASQATCRGFDSLHPLQVLAFRLPSKPCSPAGVIFVERGRSCSMEVGGWLWVLDVIGAVVLAAALIYGMANWRRRPKSPSG